MLRRLNPWRNNIPAGDQDRFCDRITTIQNAIQDGHRCRLFALTNIILNGIIEAGSNAEADRFLYSLERSFHYEV
jgi:hypothetical protein